VRAWQGFAFIALALGYPVGEGARAQHAAPQSNAQSGQHPKPAQPPSVQDSLNRIASTIEAKEHGPEADANEQRAKANLAAQKDMAKWAFWAMFVASVEVAISLAGILLIWRTLIHTRDAAKATQRMAFDTPVGIAAAVEANNVARSGVRSQLRAWVTIDLRLDDCSRNESAARIATTVVLKNIGKTPAVRVAASLNAYVRSSIVLNGVDPAKLEKWPAPMVPMMPGQEVEEMFSTRIETKDIESAVTEVRTNQFAVPIIVVDAVVYYHTVFDAEDAPKRLTSVQYLMSSIIDRDAREARIGWLDKDGPAEPEQVKFSLNKSAAVHLT
jgi:hypothetical protein